MSVAITNYNFATSDPAVAENTFQYATKQGVTSIAGWSTTGTSVFYIANGKGSNLFYASPTTYNYLAVQQNSSPTTTLTQTISLVAGETTVKFLVAPRFSSYYNTGQTVSVSLVSTTPTNPSITLETNLGFSAYVPNVNAPFVQKSYDCVTKDGSYILTFTFNYSGSADTAIMLTNIEVIQETGIVINNADSRNPYSVAITNYNFASPVVAAPNNYREVTSIAGWSTSRGVSSYLYIVSGIGGYNIFYALPTSYNYLAVEQNSSGTTTLTQTLYLVAGRTTVKFIAAPRFQNYYNQGQTVSVSLVSTTPTNTKTLETNLGFLANDPFVQKSYECVIPVDDSYILTFTFNYSGSADTNTAILLTNIEVIQKIINADKDVVDVWDSTTSLVKRDATELGFVAYDNLDLARKFVLYSEMVANSYGYTGVTGTNCNLMDSSGNDIGPKFVVYNTISLKPGIFTSVTPTATTSGKLYIFTTNTTVYIRTYGVAKNIRIVGVGGGGSSGGNNDNRYNCGGGGGGAVFDTINTFSITSSGTYNIVITIGAGGNSSSLDGGTTTVEIDGSAQSTWSSLGGLRGGLQTRGGNLTFYKGGTSGNGWLGGNGASYNGYYIGGGGGGSGGSGGNSIYGGAGAGGAGTTITFDNIQNTVGSGGGGTIYGYGGGASASSLITQSQPSVGVRNGNNGVVFMYVPN